MIAGEALSADFLVAAIALAAGYLVGSIPLAGLIGRSAGLGAPDAGARNPSAADVWAQAGPGWGLLALVGDIAKGVVPVAIGIVTWSWVVGWVAGLGVLLGASWPAFRRVPGGRPAAVFAGVAFTLAPPAGAVSVTLALIVLGVGRLVGRDARVPAFATGLATFPPLFLAVEQDLARVGAVVVLYIVAGVRALTTRGRREGDTGHSPSTPPRGTLGAVTEDTDAAEPLAP